MAAWAALAITRPLLWQIQPKREGNGYFPVSERQGDECLAIGLFAQLAAILARNAHRMLALLDQTGVINDEHGSKWPTIRSAARTSSRCRGCGSHADVAMKWCNCSGSSGATRWAIGCTLLRSPGPSQALQVYRRPAALSFMTQSIYKRSNPMLKVTSPVLGTSLLDHCEPQRIFHS
jgi:hypothetical protein